MLQASAQTMLALLETAHQTNSVTTLIDNLQHLDNFFGREKTIVELRPDIPASAVLWSWYVYKQEGGVAVGGSFYNGGLLYRDGEWSLHS